jgi:hypothetical protein
MSSCTHTHGKTLCFECSRSGIERTRARREAWAQRALPLESEARTPARLTDQAIVHRRRMLEYLETAARRA